MYIDAHIHPADYLDLCASSGDSGTLDEPVAQPVWFCCSAHDHTEYKRHRNLVEGALYNVCGSHTDTLYVGTPHIGTNRWYTDTAILHSERIVAQQNESNTRQQPIKQRILFSFGIHPQNPVTDEAEFLYSLLEKKEIQAIGECGFDLFNDEYTQLLPMQQKVWDMQLQWAQEFQLPVVIHCRKALPLIFNSVPRLKKLPAVIFHGWGGSPQEATAFLKKGVNAYFSIGKAVLRGQKSVCAMAASFDSSRLLTETDAPYMRLKAEPYSHPRDIIVVTAQCAHLRQAGADAVKQLIKQYESCTAARAEIRIAEDVVQEFSDSIVWNFKHAFGLSD